MDKNIPRVSVLMAVFNTENYVYEALKSISDQTFVDFELIVLDDGSTDGTNKILQLYAKSEPRMKLIARENRGLISTRNELLSRAQGELIAWMDSDDISSHDRLSLQISQFEKNSNLICIGGSAQVIDTNGNHQEIQRYPLDHKEIIIEQQKGGAMRFATTMMRRDIALTIKGFREPFKMGEDFDLLLRLSEKGTMGNISDIIYFYRKHPNSVCATTNIHWPSYRDTILNLAEERRVTGSDKLQRGEVLSIETNDVSKLQQLQYNKYLWQAKTNQTADSFSNSIKFILKAIKIKPLKLEAWRALVSIAVQLIRKHLKSQ